MRFLLATGWLLAVTSVPTHVAADDDATPIAVFILAGQSNMQGQGVVDLDDPRDYNGGRGTLKQVASDPSKAKVFAGVQDADGKWEVRDDVWCRYRTEQELKAGPLTIGFTGYGGKHHIGPEFQFGRVVGDAMDAPVLLIKTAWGGKSLYQDFRPPSAEGETGPFYTQMIREVHEGLEQIGKDFPELKNRPYKIAGFVWFQGWNDAVGPPEARAEYEQNLIALIKDVRREFESPQLPVVIGELGNLGDNPGEGILAIRKAQAAAAAHADFAENVAFVKTSSFARPAAESPNTGHGHHWFGNAESYFLIGDALGHAMVKLLAQKR